MRGSVRVVSGAVLLGVTLSLLTPTAASSVSFPDAPRLGCTVTWSADTTSLPAGYDAESLTAAADSAFTKWGALTEAGGVKLKFVKLPAQPRKALPRTSQHRIPVELKKNHVTVAFSNPSGEADPVLFGPRELGIGGISGGSYRFAAVNLDLMKEFPDRLENTLLHEIGHALGIDHSSDHTDVMYGGGSESVTPNRGNLHDLKTMLSPCEAPPAAVETVKLGCTVKWVKQRTKKYVYKDKVRTCVTEWGSTRTVLKSKRVKAKR